MALAASEQPKVEYRPHINQLEFHRHITAQHRCLAAGARFGKDRATVNELWRIVSKLAIRRVSNPKRYRSLLPLVHCWVVAPDYPRLRQFWEELQQFIPEARQVRVNQSSKSMTLSVTNSQTEHILIEMKSAKDPKSLVSSGLDLLVLTEGALIKDEAWEYYLQPRLISPGRAGNVIANGTPKGRNWFWRFFKDCRRKYLDSLATAWARKYPTHANPYIDRVALEALATSMPWLAYQQEILCKFLTETGGVFFGIKDCIGEVDEIKAPIVIGIDWGKLHDATVFTAMELGGGVVLRERLLKSQYLEQLDVFDDFFGLVLAMGFEADQIRIAPERNSMGEVLCELLEAKYAGLIWPFWTGAPSKRTIVEELALDIENRVLTLPDDPQLRNELEIFEFKSSGTRMTFGAPSGEFDDSVMSLAIANHARREIIERGIHRGGVSTSAH